MRSRNITHQVNRKREVQTSRTNGRPKFSQTLSSKQRSSGKLSETLAGTSAHNVGSNGRRHTIQNDHCQCTDDMDCPTRSLAHSTCQEQRCSLRSVVRWMVRVVERCWSLVDLYLLIFQRWDKDPGIPHQGWLTCGTPPCDWARATSQTSIWPEQMRELCPREAYDESSSTAGQEKTFKQLSKHHRNQKSTTWTSFQQLSLLFLHWQYEKCVKMSPL